MSDVISKELSGEGESVVLFAKYVAEVFFLCHMISIEGIRMHANKEHGNRVRITLKYSNVPMEEICCPFGRLDTSEKTFIRGEDQLKKAVRKMEEVQGPLDEIVSD